MVRMGACRVPDRGSIPRLGVFFAGNSNISRRGACTASSLFYVSIQGRHPSADLHDCDSSFFCYVIAIT